MTVYEEDIPIHIIDMPPNINSFISWDENGDVAIFIGNHLSPSQRRSCYQHELKHFKEGDISCINRFDADYVEYARH